MFAKDSILNEDFRGFLQFLQTNRERVPSYRPRSPVSKSSLIHLDSWKTVTK